MVLSIPCPDGLKQPFSSMNNFNFQLQIIWTSLHTLSVNAIDSRASGRLMNPLLVSSLEQICYRYVENIVHLFIHISYNCILNEADTNTGIDP
jgi:hypothetical protein